MVLLMALWPPHEDTDDTGGDTDSSEDEEDEEEDDEDVDEADEDESGQLLAAVGE